MQNKTIRTLILATTLSIAGVSYAVAANQQGMKNNQNCANQSEQMKDNQQCKNKSGAMEKGQHHGKNHANKQGKKHGKHNQEMGFSRLDLTAEQKQQIDDIMATAKAENQESMLAQRASMQALMSNETFDKDVARILMNQQEVQKAEKRLTMMKAKHQAFQLLTDEQKTQYSELKANRQNR